MLKSGDGGGGDAKLNTHRNNACIYASCGCLIALPLSHQVHPCYCDLACQENLGRRAHKQSTLYLLLYSEVFFAGGQSTPPSPSRIPYISVHAIRSTARRSRISGFIYVGTSVFLIRCYCVSAVCTCDARELLRKQAVKVGGQVHSVVLSPSVRRPLRHHHTSPTLFFF